MHSVRLIKDPQNPEQNKGFGFVKYYSREVGRTGGVTVTCRALLHCCRAQGILVSLNCAGHGAACVACARQVVGSWQMPLPTLALPHAQAAITAMDRLSGRELADYPGQRLRVQPSQVQERSHDMEAYALSGRDCVQEADETPHVTACMRCIHR